MRTKEKILGDANQLCHSACPELAFERLKIEVLIDIRDSLAGLKPLIDHALDVVRKEQAGE